MSVSAAKSPQELHEKPHATNRLASLDGLRAISIILVVAGHVDGTQGAGVFNLGIGDYAHLGVIVFFVISGFLITSLLLSEHQRKGTVSLRKFYARRSLRIFPPSFGYLFALLLAWKLGFLHLKGGDFLHGITYTVNYMPDSSWEIGHLWSLSVEEQFYLLWPFVFILLGTRKSIWPVILVILLAPLARIGNRFLLINTPYHDLQMFPMVADSLAMGCLLARIRGDLEASRSYMQIFKPMWSILLVALILLINRYSGYTIVSVFGTSLINLALAILIHRSVCNSGDWMGRILNWKPVAFVGVLSYSLYLWQQPFLNRNSSAWINTFPQNLLLSVAAALLSYLLLERTFLNLRRRYQA